MREFVMRAALLVVEVLAVGAVVAGVFLLLGTGAALIAGGALTVVAVERADR